MTTQTTEKPKLDYDEAAKSLLKFMFSGSMGPVKNKLVSYSLLSQDSDSFTFITALEEKDSLTHRAVPIIRYKVRVDRSLGSVSEPVQVGLSEEQLRERILRATGHRMRGYERFTDGSLSVSYKICVDQDPDCEYVLQLRHHGDVASMNTLMQHISNTISPEILPLPTVYPISDEKQHQKEMGMGIQITRFIQGTMADRVYPSMPHKDKIILLKRLARGFDALWSLQLPSDQRLIGELKAIKSEECEGKVKLFVGPDRHFSLGGPFTLIVDYLRGHIRHAVNALEKAQGIENYKQKYLPRIAAFVQGGITNIPSIVENVSIIPMHSDMGLHNIILSNTDSTEIKAIIDWEFCASAPYAYLHPFLEENFFLQKSGDEYPAADELREAFWSEMPKWKEENGRQATKVFLEWYGFAKGIVPESSAWMRGGEERETAWERSGRIVEKHLAKYS